MSRVLHAHFSGSKCFALIREALEWANSVKSTLCTDAGVDQNSQRALGAIGPYEFQAKFVCEACTGPWMALPRNSIGQMEVLRNFAVACSCLRRSVACCDLQESPPSKCSIISEGGSWGQRKRGCGKRRNSSLRGDAAVPIKSQVAFKGFEAQL